MLAIAQILVRKVVLVLRLMAFSVQDVFVSLVVKILPRACGSSGREGIVLERLKEHLLRPQRDEVHLPGAHIKKLIFPVIVVLFLDERVQVKGCRIHE